VLPITEEAIKEKEELETSELMKHLKARRDSLKRNYS